MSMNTNEKEAYWTKRNALVSDVLRLSPTRIFGFERATAAFSAREPLVRVGWENYTNACKALNAFDAEHGGAPIL